MQLDIGLKQWVSGVVVFDIVKELCDASVFFFSSRRRHTRFDCDWSSDVCSSDLNRQVPAIENLAAMKVCERHFSCWDQEQIPVAGDFEQVGFEFRQLSSAHECRGDRKSVV